jgi:lipoprotein-anchoring transpeptidase ErfK/SrfK
MADLENKTIRPGSLVGYSYYHSDRHQVTTAPVLPKKQGRKKAYAVLVVLAVFVASAFYGTSVLSSHKSPAATASGKSGSAAAAVTVKNPCTGNTLSQLILVSISKRHLWACQDNKVLYNSPVVTGISTHPDTVTPTGTYQIYAKETDTTLTGSDSTGSWSDPVHYWMPFLDNQYGTYGLHDATWRPNSAFGHISPSSPNASQGCVELPLGTAQWIYNWAPVGTTVTIEN